jgi:hypothetical protein
VPTSHEPRQLPRGTRGGCLSFFLGHVALGWGLLLLHTALFAQILVFDDDPDDLFRLTA